MGLWMFKAQKLVRFGFEGRCMRVWVVVSF